MAKTEDKVLCRTPTPNKKPTRIARARFDLVRNALLRLLPKKGEGMVFTDLFDKVEAELTPQEIEFLGSVSWYTTVVKLELEVRGEIERVEGSQPQRLRRLINRT
jgi:hypothetical protein